MLQMTMEQKDLCMLILQVQGSACTYQMGIKHCGNGSGTFSFNRNHRWH